MMLKIAVLMKNRPNGAAFQASTRLDQRRGLGMSDAFGLMISPLVFSADASIHSSGNKTISTDRVTSAYTQIRAGRPPRMVASGARRQPRRGQGRGAGVLASGREGSRDLRVRAAADDRKLRDSDRDRDKE